MTNKEAQDVIRGMLKDFNRHTGHDLCADCSKRLPVSEMKEYEDDRFCQECHHKLVESAAAYWGEE